MDLNFKYDDLKTPCFVVDEKLLIKNLEILKYVKEKTNCKILLAQKAFSMFSLYDTVGKYLDGTTASGLYEAKLGHEYMTGQTHIFSPAYNPDEFDEILEICDHIVFNSFNQWNKYKDKCIENKKSCGIRINPEKSTQGHGIYDPCAEFSRLGVTLNNFPKIEDFDLEIEGLHFHTLCQQNSDDLEITIQAVEEKFGEYLHNLKWINFGGGHHISREDYDVEKLIDIVNRIKEKYNVEVYLEPGEAVALNAGFLVATVMDIIENGMDIAILDTSAACHMPDVLEMPYRPPVLNSGLPQEKKFTYRFGTHTCLAGDIIGDYSFDEKLKIGDKVIFGDMAIYSMVKTNTFNGMKLPNIAICDSNNNLKIVKKFGYEDFKNRLS